MANSPLGQEPLQNDLDFASENRVLLEENGVVMVNLIGEPGAGKTTILEKALPLLKTRLSMAVLLEEHSGSSFDRERVRATGVEMVQVHGGEASCLNARMINEVLRQLPLYDLDFVIVESGGDPGRAAELDLGDDLKFVVTSVTEEVDKPTHDPRAFRTATAAIINKIDSLPVREFSLGAYIDQLIAINPGLKIFPLSAQNGEGIEELSSFIGRMVWKKRRNVEVA
ncbi:MAG: hydrogenase nickel incorporation protein HypB [Syntrophobacteraceae bacterium]